MGWSVCIQIVRERPLDEPERERLAAHARRYELSRKSEPYAFEVAPADARGGVIARAGGKLGREADPDRDADTARLYAALTELRTLFPEASLEVGDDLHVVGWDGARYGVVEDPDQSMTSAPADRSGWTTVPAPAAPLTAMARTKTSKTSKVLDAALAAVAEGRPLEGGEGELRELTSLAFAAIKRAEKANDRERRKQLEAVVAAVPARVVVDVGLEVRWLVEDTARSVGAAIGRLDHLDELRDRLLAVWSGGTHGDDATALWNKMGFYVMRPAMRDPQVVAALGAALVRSNFDDGRARLHTMTMSLLAERADGLPYVIARRRADRAAAKPPRFTGALLDNIAKARRREALPTLMLEVARRSADRDDLLLAMGHIDDPRVLPLLERALATDQYTRAVTRALLLVPGARSEELLEGLTAHLDPFVRICAAQGLVARRGKAAVPGLLAAAAHARAAGIWADRPPGAWANGFRDLAAVRAPIHELGRTPWPEELSTAALPEVSIAASELAVSPVRMLSTNPDVRRDAIELAHADALRARDVSRIRALVAAERWHYARCAEADLPMTTAHGTCSRVSVTNCWASWRRLARMPFDPAYRSRDVTWTWLDAHADELAPQTLPDELASVAAGDASRSPSHELRLRFAPDELAAWDEAERVFAQP